MRCQVELLEEMQYFQGCSSRCEQLSLAKFTTNSSKTKTLMKLKEKKVETTLFLKPEKKVDYTALNACLLKSVK